jgi:hypothetical protein
MHEAMVNILSHKENANQSYTKIPVRLAIIKKTNKQKMLVRMWGKRNPYTYFD